MVKSDLLWNLYIVCNETDDRIKSFYVMVQYNTSTHFMAQLSSFVLVHAIIMETV